MGLDVMKLIRYIKYLNIRIFSQFYQYSLINTNLVVKALTGILKSNMASISKKREIRFSFTVRKRTL